MKVVCLQKQTILVMIYAGVATTVICKKMQKYCDSDSNRGKYATLSVACSPFSIYIKFGSERKIVKTQKSTEHPCPIAGPVIHEELRTELR